MRFLQVLSLICTVASIDSFSISCSYTSDSRTIIGSVYTCSGTPSVSITQPNQTITSFTGSYQTTTYLYFVSKTINYVPIGIESLMPDLKGLEIYSCQLNALVKSDISGLTKLQSIQFYYNNIQTLASNVFEANTELVYINFQSNKLKTIGLNILKPLKKLTDARFSSNTCVSKDVTTAATIPDLVTMMEQTCLTEDDKKIKYCQNDFDNYTAIITEQETNYIAEIKSLKSQLRLIDANFDAATRNLYLLKNARKIPVEQTKLVCTDSDDLTVCEAYVFRVKLPGAKVEVTDQSHSPIDAKKIQTINITDMQVLYLPTELEQHVTELNTLIVVNSGLFEISEGVLDGLFSLETIDFSRNKLREIKSNTFKDQNDLFILDLSFNRIELLNEDAFNGLDKLVTLKMNDNLLFRIDGRAIEKMLNLETLTLENNALKYISPTILAPFNSLSSADFANNKCVDMVFPNNTAGEIEDHLTDNCVAPIDFNCAYRVIKSVDSRSKTYMCSPQKLKISNPKTKIETLLGTNLNDYESSDVKMLLISGQAAEFLPFELAQTFPKLEKIVVENSRLSKLQAIDFVGLTNLKEIIITGNKIKSIHPETFDTVAGLETLVLSNNAIKELPAQVFATLKSLKTLDISGNELSTLKAEIFASKKKIDRFIANNNVLDAIEPKFLKMIPGASVVDLTGNSCIDEKIDNSIKESKKIPELLGQVMMYCSED